LAAQNHFPPIAVLDSLSRLITAVCERDQLTKIQRLRKLLAAYSASEDLIRVGAYQKGADPVLDKAIEVVPALNAFLQQDRAEKCTFEEARARLLALPG
jgi:flagellum-specific ATP synthase